MLKTKIFIGAGTLSSVIKYQKFIENNQHIEILSVNILKNDHVLLTYKE